MGWFSNITSSISSAVSSAVGVVKTVAAKAINFMADKAENLVGEVKDVWKAVKPFVKKAPAYLRTAAASVAKVNPKAGLVLAAVATGVDALLALENSPVLKKIEKAISAASQKARELQRQIRNGEIAWLSPEEYEAALQTRKTLRAAEREEEALSARDRKKIELATAVNDFGIAKTDLNNAIEAGPSNFEHYLRLRATQKLLALAEARLMADGIDGLTEDDWFLVRIASDLIKADPELKSAAAERLDAVLRLAHGKTLQSFVYEELIAAWKKQSSALDAELNDAKALLAKNMIDLRRLQLAKRVQNELDPREAAELAALQEQVPAQEKSWEAATIRKRDIERYADAAEGFLQLLEKSPDELEAEDRGYVIDEGENVGRIIVEAAENNTPFSGLAPDDQALITDFANIFHAEAKQRMESVLEVSA